MKVFQTSGLVALGVALSLACELFAQAPKRSDSEIAYDKLVNETAAVIAGKFESKTRVAVFTFGDEKSGIGDGEFKGYLLEATDRFIQDLHAAAKERFIVLTPRAIQAEMIIRNANRGAVPGLSPDKPKEVADWLKKTFNSEIGACIFVRCKKALVDKVQAEAEVRISVIDKEGALLMETNTKDVKSVKPIFLGDPYAGGVGASGRVIVPRLMAIDIKSDKETEIVTYRENSTLVAYLTEELEEKMQAGKLALAIGLGATGNLPTQLADETGNYTLADDQSRLLTAAVLIDRKGTIAQDAPNPFSKNGDVSKVFPQCPPLNVRKWVLAQPGQHISIPRTGQHIVAKAKANESDDSKLWINGYQRDNQSASMFLLCAPSSGSAFGAGIESSPGVIDICLYAEKKPRDEKVKHLTTVQVAEHIVSIKHGPVINSQVVPINVQCYKTPIETIKIFLRTKSQFGKEGDPVERKLPKFVTE